MAIVRVALPVAAHQLFDYWLPDGLVPDAGSVLVVRLGRRRLHGVAVEIVESSEIAPERLMPIDEVVSDVPPVPDDLRELAGFVSTYYQEPIGLCLAQMLPPLAQGSASRTPLARAYRLTTSGQSALVAKEAQSGTALAAAIVMLRTAKGVATDELRKQGTGVWRAFARWRREGWVEPLAEMAGAEAATPALNPDQRAALDAAVVEPLAFRPSLLQGVTGSGKTEVYLAAAARVIDTGRQVLLLVPEINLTPQLEQRIARGTGDKGAAVKPDHHRQPILALVGFEDIEREAVLTRAWLSHRRLQTCRTIVIRHADRRTLGRRLRRTPSQRPDGCRCIGYSLEGGHAGLYGPEHLFLSRQDERKLLNLGRGQPGLQQDDASRKRRNERPHRRQLHARGVRE